MTVVNAYSVDADVTFALPEQSAFTLSDTASGPIPALGSAQFTVTPRADLAPGRYTETLTVSDGSHSARVTLTVPVCVELTLEKDGRMGNMTGEAGLYLPGEAVGVSAARQNETVAWTWTANGVETPTMFSFDHQIASPGTDAQPYYVMPETDVTLRATGIIPNLELETDTLTRGGTLRFIPFWRTNDGERTDYDEPFTVTIKDQSGNDVSAYFVTTWEKALVPLERCCVTASPDLPDTAERIELRLAGERHPNAFVAVQLDIVGPQPEPEPEPYAPAASGDETGGTGETGQTGETSETGKPVFPDAARAAACQHDEACALAAFADLDPVAWYHDGVHFCLENGMMHGVGDGLFDPEGDTSRAMIVTILWRLEGAPASGEAENPFRDAEDGAWYADAVIWAAVQGIVGGDAEGLFRPTAPLTREQLAAILYRYAQYRNLGFPDTPADPPDYPDADKISPWAEEAMLWCVTNGVIHGSDGRLHPGGEASRAQLATMLLRLLRS